MRGVAIVVLLLIAGVIACSSAPSNPLRCTSSQGCYDCLKTSCSSQLATAEVACRDFLTCRQGSCSDTNCVLKATPDCNDANDALARCEPVCTPCPK